MNSKVDFYFDKAGKWEQETRKLRSMLLDCGLTETLKWGVPCYTFQENNIVLIHVFKAYCAVLFFKGALLKDAEQILVRQTEHVQAARQLRFTSVQEIEARESVLKSYVFEAVEVEQAGLEVIFKKTTEFDLPEEFRQKLDELPGLKTAFGSLTPGRQRAYLLHFSQPTQSKTRTARVEKCIPRILIGKGLND